MNRPVLLLPALLLLAACDRLGLPSPGAESAAREAEARAIGAACRHAGQALEDCYVLNARASKAAIFAGWREMNDYMTANKIEVVKPELSRPGEASTSNTVRTEDSAPEADSARTRYNRNREARNGSGA